MSLADEARDALKNPAPGHQKVGGHSFPSIGARQEDQIKALEAAVAALANSLGIVIDGVNELEKGAS